MPIDVDAVDGGDGSSVVVLSDSDDVDQEGGSNEEERGGANEEEIENRTQRRHLGTSGPAANIRQNLQRANYIEVVPGCDDADMRGPDPPPSPQLHFEVNLPPVTPSFFQQPALPDLVVPYFPDRPIGWLSRDPDPPAFQFESSGPLDPDEEVLRGLANVMDGSFPGLLPNLTLDSIEDALREQELEANDDIQHCVDVLHSIDAFEHFNSIRQ